MKLISCFTLAVCLCYLQIASALTPTNLWEYTDQVFQESDRQYEPLTKDMCRTRQFRNLKSCILLRSDDDKLRDYSDEYLSYPFNYWKDVESKDSVGALNADINNILGRTSYQYLNARRRRSSGKYDGTDVSDNVDHVASHRSKRDIPGNPCSTGKAKRTTMLFGVDAETGDVLELFQDPDSRMYQTFFTRRCHVPTFFSFHCEIQYVEYMAAVYEKNGYDVVVRPVKIPTGCALSIRY